MIESLILAVAFFCQAPDIPTDDEVRAVLTAGTTPSSIYGASPYRLPTADADELTYRVTVDPIFKSYAPCFYQQVTEILEDSRGWDGVREARRGEIPRVWIILTPPGGSCATVEWPYSSCAAGIHGRGQIWVNAGRWFSGYEPVANLEDSRTQLINHEIGHMLGHAHMDCTVMGYYPSHPEIAGGPWDVEYDSCVVPSWPVRFMAGSQL